MISLKIRDFKGPWGIPDVADGVTDVESAAHGFVSFDTGQVLELPNFMGRDE